MRNLNRLKRWEMAIGELVQNSIDALVDSTGNDGEIEIRCFRETKALIPDEQPPISEIMVIDNGHGFHKNSFTSFRTPDSTRKLHRGGKGIGRLGCLTVFETLKVDSDFHEDGRWQKRVAQLKETSPYLISAINDLRGEDFVPRTKVSLTGLRDDYQRQTQISLKQISDWIREHFLPFLISKPDWLKSFKLVVVDKEKSEPVDLCASVIGKEIWKEEFKVGAYNFTAECHTVNAAETTNDKVRLVAAGRVVNSNTRPLGHYLPHVETVAEKPGCVILVHSPYFDERVNDARNAVSFETDENDESTSSLGSEFQSLTAEKFREKFSRLLSDRMKDRLVDERRRFRNEISEIVAKRQPSYRSMLNGYFESSQFTKLKRDSSPSDILQSLDGYRRKDVEMMSKMSRKLSRMKASAVGYEEKARELASKIDIQKKVALAEYVSLRKIIIERLEQIIGREDDTQSRERDLHDLVFPQRCESESNMDHPHQLWIIDERLESHSYLASDLPLDAKKGDRPDLLIALDRPGAFGTSAGADSYDSIILVEFKRPLEDLDTVATDRLPHRQLLRYAEQITNGKAKHFKSKRPFKARSDTRFYMYAICELSERLLDRLEVHEQFTPTPSLDGAFSVTNKGKWYFEYMSLGKLLHDSKLRNSSFFKRLGLD